MTRGAVQRAPSPSTRATERGLGKSPKVLSSYTLCNGLQKGESPAGAGLAFIHSRKYTGSAIKNRHGISASLLFRWRKLMHEGGMAAVGAGEEVVSASEVKALKR